MTDDQRDTAARDGWISEQVTVSQFEPTPDSQHVIYSVRVYVTERDSHVDVTPEPPGARDRNSALLEARRLLQHKFDQATAAIDRRLLMRAKGNLTRGIQASS